MVVAVGPALGSVVVVTPLCHLSGIGAGSIGSVEDVVVSTVQAMSVPDLDGLV